MTPFSLDGPKYIDIHHLYNSNIQFSEYVDQYAHTYRISVEEALVHALVKEYADYIIKERRNNYV